MKIELKGSYTGVKKFKQLKNPDILYSIIKLPTPEKCEKNELTIDQKQNNEYFVYHMYDSIVNNYSGRWYKTNFIKNDFKFNDNKMKVTYIIPEYEIELPTYHVINNVKVDIYFTPKGYKKLLQIFS